MSQLNDLLMRIGMTVCFLLFILGVPYLVWFVIPRWQSRLYEKQLRQDEAALNQLKERASKYL
jgi:hypothetical protein